MFTISRVCVILEEEINLELLVTGPQGYREGAEPEAAWEPSLHRRAFEIHELW